MAILITPMPYTSTKRFELLPFLVQGVESLWALLCWKVRMFTLLGIDFSINASTVALPVFLFACCGLDWTVAIYLLVVVATILIHEIGHAIGGYLVGNPAREIVLIACGGYTIPTEDPGATAGDALMSVFGPLANALTCLLLTILESLLFGGTPGGWLKVLLMEVMGMCPVTDGMPELFDIMAFMAKFNLYVLLFNLIPAFPLDGGRVLRWFSGCFLTPIAAARLTMFVSRACALVIAIQGVIKDVVLDRDFLDLGVLALVVAWIWFGSLAEVWRTEEA